MHKKLEALDDATRGLIQKEIDSATKAETKRCLAAIKEGVEIPEDKAEAKVAKTVLKQATDAIKAI